MRGKNRSPPIKTCGPKRTTEQRRTGSPQRPEAKCPPQTNKSKTKQPQRFSQKTNASNAERSNTTSQTLTNPSFGTASRKNPAIIPLRTQLVEVPTVKQKNPQQAEVPTRHSPIERGPNHDTPQAKSAPQEKNQTDTRTPESWRANQGSAHREEAKETKVPKAPQTKPQPSATNHQKGGKHSASASLRSHVSTKEATHVHKQPKAAAPRNREGYHKKRRASATRTSQTATPQPNRRHSSQRAGVV